MIDIDKCQITHYPADVLKGVAQPVEKIDDNIRRLVDKMYELMLELKGVGFAAPQAGVPLRIFIISIDGDRDQLKVFINPTVTPDGPLEAMEEGCLSVPGLWTKIRRYTRAQVTAMGLDGKEFTEKAEGLYARALQHEYDHIEGITIINRMGQAARIAHRKQIKKLEENTKDDGR